MKRFVLLLAGAVCALCAGAQAVAHYPVTSYNFGAFDEETGPVSCRFAVVNTGTEPLSILAARATCGCTQPTYPRRPVAPGDTAWIDVTYDPLERPGRFNKQIYVETNTTPAKTRLDISGVVIGAGSTVARRYPADFGPLKMAHPALMMGDVVKGRLKTVYFDGYNQSADSLTIKAVRQPSYIDIVSAPEVAPPGEQVTLIAYVNAAKCPLYGLVEDSITISVNPGSHTYTLPMTLIVNEDFSAMSPSQMAKAPSAAAAADRIDFGRIGRTDGSVTRSITITNTGKSPLEIRRVYSADPGITATVDARKVKKGKSATVTVTVDPAALPGDLLNARLNVITNDPLHPITVIRLVGELR